MAAGEKTLLLCDVTHQCEEKPDYSRPSSDEDHHVFWTEPNGFQRGYGFWTTGGPIHVAFPDGSSADGMPDESFFKMVEAMLAPDRLFRVEIKYLLQKATPPFLLLSAPDDVNGFV